MLRSGALLLLATTAIFFSCSTSPTVDAAVAKPVGDRKSAPDFQLKDANGTPVRLSDYRGKVVLLNFWATWCGPCKIEIPWFMEFEQQYRDKGLEVLGVAMDDDGWSAVKPYVAERKMNYRVVLGNDSVATLYGGIDSLPTTFVIDRQGNIASVHIGLVGKNAYLSEIQSLLGVHQASGASRAGGAVPALLHAGAGR